MLLMRCYCAGWHGAPDGQEEVGVCSGCTPNLAGLQEGIARVGRPVGVVAVMKRHAGCAVVPWMRPTSTTCSARPHLYAAAHAVGGARAAAGELTGEVTASKQAGGSCQGEQRYQFDEGRGCFACILVIQQSCAPTNLSWSTYAQHSQPIVAGVLRHCNHQTHQGQAAAKRRQMRAVPPRAEE